MYNSGEQKGSDATAAFFSLREEASSLLLYVKAAWWWLLPVTVVGSLLRGVLAFGWDIALPYQYLLHTHSHIALFGWMENALFGITLSLLASYYHRDVQLFARRLWVVLQVCTVGAFFAFLFSGYSAIAIVFSTLHIILWWLVAGKWFSALRKQTLARNTSLVPLLFSASLIMLCVCSLGTIALPPIMILHLGEQAKNAAVEWFLHGFSEGWLLMASLGIVSMHQTKKQLQNQAINPQYSFVRVCVVALCLLIPLTSLRGIFFALPEILQHIVALSSVLLGMLWLCLLFILRSRFDSALLRLMAALFIVKAGMDIVIALPFAQILMQERSVRILYLHTKLLGITSIAIAAYSERFSSVFSSTSLNTFGALATILIAGLGLISSSQILFPPTLPSPVYTTAQHLTFSASVGAAVCAAWIIFRLVKRKEP